MAFQSAPDCAEAVIRATYGGKNIANVLNFHKVGGYSQADIDQLAAVVDDNVGSGYLALLSGNVTYVDTLVRGLTSDTDLTAAQNANAGVGTVSGGSYPANASACITLRTGFTGRSARGRFYAMPTGTSNGLGVNTVSTTYLDALVDFLQAVAGDADLEGWDLVVLSRFHNKAERETATFLDVTSISYRNNVLDSQRGRLPVGH